jgi:hypothetical protein
VEENLVEMSEGRAALCYHSPLGVCSSSSHRPCSAYRYIVSVKVGDSTGEAWVSIFNEQAEALIGMSADELAQIKEEVSSALTVWLACRFL